MASFKRRLETLDDIKANEILFLNKSQEAAKIPSIFDSVSTSKSTQFKRSQFDGIQEVSIETFMKDILPSCTGVEVFLANNMTGNLVNLTTSEDKDSKPIFKWNNNYSYTFNGNIAGKPQIKEAVKSRGGATDGVLNIRLAFPETDSDYDLHVVEPNGGHIYYSNVRTRQRSSGMLDLDAQGVDGHQVPEKRVENINYTNLNAMPHGIYLVYVKNYNTNRTNNGFTLEIEDFQYALHLLKESLN